MKFLSVILIILLINLSIFVTFGEAAAAIKPEIHQRNKRGYVTSSLKGALVGALANKALGGSAKKGAMVGAAAGGLVKYMRRRNRQQLVY
uniref:Glycine zipper 2TM domain-containing protein n=1 Tax=Panagrolaimus sp. ES5 TaxID=591445 RepID=A0AC34G1I3_9BILA